jgi:hypothetical protein
MESTLMQHLARAAFRSLRMSVANNLRLPRAIPALPRWPRWWWKCTLPQQICGIPNAARSTKGHDQVDVTGYGRWFRIDDVVLRLDQIVECTVWPPAG